MHCRAIRLVSSRFARSKVNGDTLALMRSDGRSDWLMLLSLMKTLSYHWTNTPERALDGGYIRGSIR